MTFEGVQVFFALVILFLRLAPSIRVPFWEFKSPLCQLLYLSSLVGWLVGSRPARVSEARPALPPRPKLGVQAGRKLDAAKTQATPWASGSTQGWRKCGKQQSK